MKKSILLIVLIFSSSVFASNYDKGITTYKKSCKKCHGSPYFASQQYDEDQWLDFFDNDDEKLLKAHASDSLALSKFKSSYYKNRRESLVEFLSENAKDSGVVPPCTSHTCGIVKPKSIKK